jgi:MFS family permease
MQNPLLAWIVMELTDSTFLFGLVMSLRFAFYIIGPMSGVVADRVNRRTLLIVFKAIQIAIAVFLGTLIIGGQIQLWHVIVIILLQSIINLFNFPAQSAFSVDVVGQEDITNATALQSVSMYISGLIGPSLVGAFVNQIGIGVFYYLNAIIYLIALILLLMIRGIPKTNIDEENQLIYFITNLFPIATRRTLMWVFAKNVLQVDASGLGWLSTANTLGGFAVNIIVAQLGTVKGKGKLVVVSSILWGVMWIIFSTSNSFYLTLIYLIVMSIVSALTMMLAQVIILINSEPEMRGRALGIRSLGIGSQFPGSILAGAIAENLGEPFAVGLEGVFMVISMLIIIKMVPSLSKTD